MESLKEKIIQKFQIMENEKEETKGEKEANYHFGNYFQYILSLIGFAAGYGSFWRFPYLVYKNGGGAFLIPYFLALIFIGIPLLYLETLTGQMHQCSTPIIFSKINKGYKFIGVTFMIICFHFSGYYNIILAYSYQFLFSSFSSQLPFANQTPFEDKYFKEYILNQSKSIEQFGSINPGLFFFYIISLVICYLIVRNGVKQSGKIVVVTALLPYFSLIVLAIRGIFLSGAVDGLKFLFYPDFTKLFNARIWVQAIVQVLYQMALAVGAIVNLSSMKPKKQRNLLGVFLIPFSVVVCGLLAASNVFMYLGHFCEKQNLTIDELTLSGPELSFNIFPKALSILPWPNLWVFLFFLTMIFLGIDTQFGALETVFCYLKDQVESKTNTIKIWNRKYNFQNVKLIFTASVCVFCPFVTSSAGIYYLQYFDSFVATIPLSLGALINYIFFVKIIPFEQLQNLSKKHSGESVPHWIKYLLQSRIIITVLIGNFILACINQFFFFFNYSIKFYVVGWMITVYPYVIAYLYYRYNKQEKDRTSFAELEKIKYQTQ